MKKIIYLLALWCLTASSADAYYQAEQGRWLNRDPISETGGMNVYGFVANQPVGAFDRWGLFSFPPDETPDVQEPVIPGPYDPTKGLEQTVTCGDGGLGHSSGNTPSVSRLPPPSNECQKGDFKSDGDPYVCEHCTCPKKCQDGYACIEIIFEFSNGNGCQKETHKVYMWSITKTTTCK